ncbi:MAG: cephalosporin hydroxylase family protein [Rhodocyclaceae bacterium]|jgi:cephalosporin hydroxylase|nr:cephalosporin hydroxylase family protein [Rhodocyclaceae bacterium]
MSDFQQEVKDRIDSYENDESLKSDAADFMRSSIAGRYSYNFSWLGRPIIQYPQDMVAMQELIWSIQPDLIIETGIAHGGSLIFSASMLELNAVCGGPGDALVLGVDIDIRPHNRQAIEAHPLFRRIGLIQGSSIADDVVAQVRARTAGKRRILVCLDSNHTHDHVLAELQAYAPLVSVGSYCVVFDTVVEDLPAELSSDRPWDPGNNPKTAVREYLKDHPEFEVDKAIERKLQITVAPDGYLRRCR